MATLRKINGKTATKLISGKMYFYRYKATETEYYNKFPLIFMLRKRGNLFEGIDFHYLDLKRRIELFENMKPYFSTEDVEEKTVLFVRKFRIIIQKSKIFRSAKVSFRKYKKENKEYVSLEKNIKITKEKINGIRKNSRKD